MPPIWHIDYQYQTVKNIPKVVNHLGTGEEVPGRSDPVPSVSAPTCLGAEVSVSLSYRLTSSMVIGPNYGYGCNPHRSL